MDGWPKDPRLKIIQATHTADLAVDFGRKTKNLVDQQNYKELFDTRLHGGLSRLLVNGKRNREENTLLPVLVEQ